MAHDKTKKSSTLFLKLSFIVLLISGATYYVLNDVQLNHGSFVRPYMENTLDVAIDTWNIVSTTSKLVFRNIFGVQSRIDSVLNGLLQKEQSVPVHNDSRIAIGFGACTDLIVRAVEVLRKLPVPDKSEPHSTIESMENMLELFAYYFKHGAASERYIKSKHVFNELLDLINQSKSELKTSLGGNAPLMSVRFAKEGIQNILLGAQMSQDFAEKLPENVIISGPIIEKDDYHILLEYKTEETWGQYKSPRANRLIVHSDDNNAQIISRSNFFNKAIEFQPELLIVSGLQMLDNSPISFDNRSLGIELLGSELKNIRKTFQEKNPDDDKLKIHFEMASYTENQLLDIIVNQIFPYVDSFGMNEQEVANLLSFVKFGNISFVTSPFPRIALVLDQMRELFSILNLIGESRISRIHVHTLAYQVVMIKLDSSGQPMWPYGSAAMAKASLTAFRHTCAMENVDGNFARILLDDSFSTSETMKTKRRIFFDQPTKCWTEEIVNPIEFTTKTKVQFCLAIGMVCTKVVQTGGAGDNVSAGGIVLQI